MKVFLTSLVLMLAVIEYGQVVLADKEGKGGKTSFKVLGKSGKMRVSTPGKTAVVINFDDMKEVDKSSTVVGKTGRKKHSFNTFASQKFNFTPVVKRQYNGFKTKTFNFSATIPGTGATLNVEVYIFLQKGDFVNGNETTPVSNGTVKFNIELKNWEFCNGSSNCKKGEHGEYVDLTISLSSKSKPKRKQDGAPGGPSPPRGGKRRQEEYELGDALLALSRQVDVDGAIKEMPEGYPKHESKGGKEYFVFRFPKFNGRVFYDPSITMEEESSSSAVRFGASVAIFLGGLIAAILANF